MPLEVLDRTLVLLGCGARFERSQIPAPSGLRIELAGVQPVLAGAEFSYHTTRWCDRCTVSSAGRGRALARSPSCGNLLAFAPCFGQTNGNGLFSAFHLRSGAAAFQRAALAFVHRSFDLLGGRFAVFSRRHDFLPLVDCLQHVSRI